MKKLGLMSLISILIMSSNLYCFDLIDDAFDFIEDIGKLVGIVLMILVVMYFIKKVLKDDRTTGKIKKYDDRDYDDYDDRERRRRRDRRERRNLRDDRDYRRRADDYDDYYDYDNYDDRRDYRNYDDRNDNRPRREKVIDDRQYEYDMRDYDRREKRLPNNINSNNIDKRENDSKYEKVYELKPEYKLKSDNNKRIR